VGKRESAGYAWQTASTLARVQAREKDAEDAAAQQQFDKFMGSDAGAFAYGDYDEDDKEADEIYAQVEETMDGRRKVRGRAH
jgi:pre-mRNA-processing factor 6